jgi:hypothetical protein
MAGPASSNEPGTYNGTGAQGSPSSRIFACLWSLESDIWLFGGQAGSNSMPIKLKGGSLPPLLLSLSLLSLPSSPPLSPLTLPSPSLLSLVN